MMTQQAAPSLSSFTCEWTYDVFLSFRGEDTRLGFTGHLYNSLNQKGIHTFIDDEELQKGEEITPALLKAIQESRIAIIVFSKHYASSTYCLDELANILQCLQEEGRLVWPIFYDVNPSQVGHQTGTYAEALEKHEKRFKDDFHKVQRWRKALCKAAKLSGSHFKPGCESEYKFIGKIVEEVSKKINRPPLHVADKPVGLESQVLKVTSLLTLGSDEGVNMVGIYGIGGIGKTTIARAVYNLIADQFEGCCFLADIREKAINKHELVKLQETLLRESLWEKDIKVGDVNRGIPIIKRRLQKKKVLLILDDVDNLVQLKVLAGECNWFGSGSKIIFTTRNKHLLVTYGVVKLHEVELLNHEKALELFSRHAFKSDNVDLSYVDISKRAVYYADGLPLALEVIGSHLFDKTLDECYSALDKYEKTPHKDIHEILKVSYDGLDEDEKGIFLDIACFFNTYKINYVKEMLHAHSFHAEDGIRVLADKSLIKIDDDGSVRMHDLIRDMGREIVRQESRTNPGKRSRLWFDKDIVHVLQENTGTDKIEVIMLEVCDLKEVQWSGIAFKKMINLRILIIGNAIFSRGPQHLPNSLRVLDWSYYPSPSLPSTFNPIELMILNLPASCLQSFQPLKRSEFLWLLNFEDCKFLTKLPSLFDVPLLRHLCLDNCSNLITIDSSIGFLGNLLSFSAKECTQLEILAPCINLPSLEVLDLTGCSSLKYFPEVLGKMYKIRVIYLDRSGISKFPFSVGNLVGLKHLYLTSCKFLMQLPSSIHTLPKVEVITSFIPGRRFWLFKEKEKVSSESQVCPGSLVVICNKGEGMSFTHLHMSQYISPNNVIQLCTSNLSEPPDLLEMFDECQCMIGETIASKKSSTRFWFRNKFPRITLCCYGKFNLRVEDLVYFKFKVIINGTIQVSSSCTYMTTFSEIVPRRQILCCDLQCRTNGGFMEHKWNHVEILCKLHFPKPCKYGSQATTVGFMRSTHIYVNQERNCMEDIKFNYPSYPPRKIKGMKLVESIFQYDTIDFDDSKANSKDGWPSESLYYLSLSQSPACTIMNIKNLKIRLDW